MLKGKKGTWGDSWGLTLVYVFGFLILGLIAIIQFIPNVITAAKLNRQMKANAKRSVETRFISQMCASGQARFYESTRSTLRKNYTNDEQYYKAMDEFLRKNSIPPS